MSYQTYVSCKTCSGIAQPGTKNLMGYLLIRFPQTRSMGIYNCRVVAGQTSLSQHACGRAGDSGIPTLPGGGANTDLGYPVVLFLDQYSTELGITEQIYNRVRYSAAYPRGKYYGGVHPHYDHIHWSQTPTKASSLSYADIVAVAGPPTEEQILRRGDKNAMVAEVQHALKKFWSYDIGTWPPWPGKSNLDVGHTFGPGEDGDFGAGTETLVKTFQKAFSMAQTGVVDGVTAAAIFCRYGPAAQAPPAPDLSGLVTKTAFAAHTHPQGPTGKPN